MRVHQFWRVTMPTTDQEKNKKHIRALQSKAPCRWKSTGCGRVYSGRMNFGGWEWLGRIISPSLKSLRSWVGNNSAPHSAMWRRPPPSTTIDTASSDNTRIAAAGIVKEVLTLPHYRGWLSSLKWNERISKGLGLNSSQPEQMWISELV